MKEDRFVPCTWSDELNKAKQRWDLNQERTFLEKLLQQRFNFFIVTFSIVMLAGTAASSVSELNFVLVVGFLFTLLIGLSLYRVFAKVDTVLFVLHQCPEHCMHRVSEAAKKKWPLLCRMNDVLGYVIPLFCLIIIIVWCVLANSEMIQVK